METARALEELRRELGVIQDLEAASAVLDWDQATYMPPGGAPARARQLALLGRLAHERRASPRMGELLASVASVELEGDTVDAALVRLARRAYDRAARIPSELVAEQRDHRAASFLAWTKARPRGDFAAMVPYLEKSVALSRRFAEYFPELENPADYLIDEMDPGMTARRVRDLFDGLRRELVPLARQIAARPLIPRDCLEGTFDVGRQAELAATIVQRIGYDFERGRQDPTHHPFMTRFSGGDVRIATHYVADDPLSGLFGAIHEAGHGLYEQSIEPAYDGTPLGAGASAGVHESQSRLWENVVGRSRAFWAHFYPALQEAFPAPFADLPLEDFYRAVNRVEPSLIRIEADEVTYNLHVMLRFELEQRLLTKDLEVRDLPEAWAARMTADLGVAPRHHGEGVLQDVHWFADAMGGAFQGYTIGNIMSAQFYTAALAERPGVPGDIAEGRFDSLRGWLSERVHRHGARYLPLDLVERATGSPLTHDHYVAYLRTKYEDLYAL